MPRGIPKTSRVSKNLEPFKKGEDVFVYDVDSDEVCEGVVEYVNQVVVKVRSIDVDGAFVYHYTFQRDTQEDADGNAVSHYRDQVERKVKDPNKGATLSPPIFEDDGPTMTITTAEDTTTTTTEGASTLEEVTGREEPIPTTRHEFNEMMLRHRKRLVAAVLIEKYVKGKDGVDGLVDMLDALKITEDQVWFLFPKGTNDQDEEDEEDEADRNGQVL